MEYGNILSSEDKILTKTCRNIKDFLHEDLSRNTLTKIEKTNIGRLSVAVIHDQFDRTHCRKPSATVIPTADIIDTIEERHS